MTQNKVIKVILWKKEIETETEKIDLSTLKMTSNIIQISYFSHYSIRQLLYEQFAISI